MDRLLAELSPGASNPDYGCPSLKSLVLINAPAFSSHVLANFLETRAASRATIPLDHATLGCFSISAEDVASTDLLASSEWRDSIWELTDVTMILRVCDPKIDDDTEPEWSLWN